MLRGIGTSKGIGIGKALIIHKCKKAVSRAKINDTEAEVDKFNEAVEKFIQETMSLWISCHRSLMVMIRMLLY